MFGLTNLHWRSLLSPVQPPRPNLDPLTGGYRRIPVAQLGADIFCDTALIAREVATITGCALLNPATIDPTAAALVAKAEREVFFAAISTVDPKRLLMTMFRQFGALGTYRFVKDRAGLLKGGTVRPAQGSKAKKVFNSFLSELESRLSEYPWVGGQKPSVADFATYHPLWLHVSCSRRPLKSGPKVGDWYERVSRIGHGRRNEITRETAFREAREAEPRPLPDRLESESAPIGREVKVAPLDYGVVPVTGVLASVTDERIILARVNAEFGRLHVHFPRVGYSIVTK